MVGNLNLFYNALWIFGLAVILAAFSYAGWQASENEENLRRVLSRSSFQFPFSIGLAIISLSLALLAQTWWERLIWLLFLGLFLLQSWQSRKIAE